MDDISQFGLKSVMCKQNWTLITCILVSVGQVWEEDYNLSLRD